MRLICKYESEVQHCYNVVLIFPNSTHDQTYFWPFYFKTMWYCIITMEIIEGATLFWENILPLFSDTHPPQIYLYW